MLGFIIPFLPLFRSLKDRDRRFYVFIEQPVIGLVVTLASLYIAEELAAKVHNFDAAFARNFLEIYLAYQAANIIRDGVNTDSTITGKKKVFLNWYYSVASYVLFTASDRLAKAKNEQELLFAYGIVLFSLLWPIFSQVTSTYLWTNLLFSKFPRRSLLVRLSDLSISQAELLREEKDVWNIRWINWFRKSRNLKVRNLQYWIIKTVLGVGIGIVMTTLYYLSRWSLVGMQAGDPKFLVDFVSFFR